ncbi:ubiquinone biosynthesis accessory factor UbiJ [Shewanella cyperi]|uniref:ubiquinone biosynthesis accessory factor UbiJ n=1 Tax=Shewanella cyperi TaxID=2814292 RepID=UPI001D18A8D8|nr:SCP2 sterol-binding domain-containing protein [Shewanella cyperi]
MLQRELALLACGAIELAFNGLLKQSGAQLRSYGLNGKVIAIELKELPFPLYLIFDQTVLVLSRYEAEPSVAVKADLACLYQLSRGANLSALIKQDKLELDGDLHALQGLSRLMTEQRFDFGEPLSRWIGDGATHRLQSGLGQLGQELRRITGKSLDHMAQLATEEYRLAPQRIEFIAQCDAIEDLARDTDAQIQRLQHLRERFSL